MVDPKVVAGVKKLVFTFPYLYSGVETWNFVQYDFHLEMCILSEWEDPVMSYGGSKRDGVCEIACAHIFS
jgi:hypothetical protein